MDKLKKDWTNFKDIISEYHMDIYLKRIIILKNGDRSLCNL